MASKQKLFIPNKNYEKALIWFERQTEYVIDAKLTGTNVNLKLIKNGIIQKTTTEPFDVNYHLVIQDKILNLYNHFNKN